MFAGTCVNYDPTLIFLQLNLQLEEVLEISSPTTSSDRWRRPHVQYEYILTFSYSWLIPQGFFKKIYLSFSFHRTWDTIKLARIQVNTSSPHSLSSDLLSQRWKTLPLRLLNTWGLCARAKSPAGSGTATGRPTKGEHLEWGGQLPDAGTIAGIVPENSCGFVDLIQESFGAGSWPLFGEKEKELEKGTRRRRRKGNENYLENYRIEMWILPPL